MTFKIDLQSLKMFVNSTHMLAHRVVVEMDRWKSTIRWESGRNPIKINDSRDLEAKWLNVKISEWRNEKWVRLQIDSFAYFCSAWRRSPVCPITFLIYFHGKWAIFDISTSLRHIEHLQSCPRKCSSDRGFISEKLTCFLFLSISSRTFIFVSL